MKRVFEILDFFTGKGDKGCGDYWNHDWITSVVHYHESDPGKIMPYHECRNAGCREVTTAEFYKAEAVLKQATDLIN